MSNEFDLTNVRQVPFNGYYICSYDSKKPVIKDFQGLKDFLEEVESLFPDLTNTIQVWFRSESSEIQIFKDGELLES